MGGGAAGDASIASRPGEIDRLVLLGAAPNGPADKLKSSTLFIVARDDASGDGPRLPRIQEQYELAPGPKDLIILDGSAHRSVSLPNGPRRPRDARDPPLSFHEVNSSVGLDECGV
jgi:hypothetical protein